MTPLLRKFLGVNWVIFAIMIVVLLVRPAGLFGRSL